MNKKTFYEAPQAELIVVRFEENIMSPTFSSTDNTEEPIDGGDENF